MQCWQLNFGHTPLYTTPTQKHVCLRDIFLMHNPWCLCKDVVLKSWVMTSWGCIPTSKGPSCTPRPEAKTQLKSNILNLPTFDRFIYTWDFAQVDRAIAGDHMFSDDRNIGTNFMEPYLRENTVFRNERSAEKQMRGLHYVYWKENV